jgi:hypothetical protein
MATGKRKSERSTRRKLCSPGRPPVWQRESLCRFWLGIAAGLSSEEAGVKAGVSAPVGVRWFRSSGGMPPTHLAPSAPRPQGRNLSFAEREEIALECAQDRCVRPARSPARSGATPPPVAGISITVPSPRSGMRTVQPNAPRPASSRTILPCVTMCRTGSQAG